MTGDERLVRDIVRQHCLPNAVWADQDNIRRFLDEVERQDRFDCSTIASDIVKASGARSFGKVVTVWSSGPRVSRLQERVRRGCQGFENAHAVYLIVQDF